jgi:hypothetical protein
MRKQLGQLPTSNSQLPTHNSQFPSLDPQRCPVGIGGWKLGVDARQVLTTATLIAVGGSSSLLACPVCFGAEETSMIDGAKLGIAVLLVITLAVQGAFLSFFLYLRRRAKRIAEIDLDTEWSELQGASRT